MSDSIATSVDASHRGPRSAHAAETITNSASAAARGQGSEHSQRSWAAEDGGRPPLPASGPAAEPFQLDAGDRFAQVFGVGLTFFFVLRQEHGVFRVAWVGENVSAILGYSVAETLQPDWWIARVHPDDRPRALANHAILLSRGHLVHEYRFRHKDGGYRWVRDELRIMPDTTDQPTQITGCWFDITDRKRAELALAASEARLQSLSRRLLEVQEHERRFLACELHDEVGQLLTGLGLQLEMAARAPAGEVRARLAEAQGVVRDLTRHVRDLSLRLRPTMLDDLGLVPALVWLVDRVAASSGVQVALEHWGVDGGLPTDVATAAYRIVQEALTNVVRHAGVKEANVSVGCADGLLGIAISDHGAGFDPMSGGARTGGLSGMRERAELLGGEFAVTSALGRGTRVSVHLPLTGSPTKL